MYQQHMGSSFNSYHENQLNHDYMPSPWYRFPPRFRVGSESKRHEYNNFAFIITNTTGTG